MSTATDSDEEGTNNSPAAPGLQDFSLQAEDNANEVFDLEKMSQADLLVLHGKIEARLSGLTLDEVDLTRETLLQLQKAKHLQAEASKKDSKVPMNQQAQVQNSIANIITTLAKVQMDLFTSERHKRIQAAVVRVVKTLEKDKQDAFFELLAQDLGEVERSMEGTAP